MWGCVQAQNSALALLVLRTLGMYKKGLTEKAFEENKLPGRLERVDWKRPLYLDGAHTQNSLGHLLETFKEMYPNVKTTGVCIFGSVNGKNHDAMCDEILNCFDKIIVCRPGTFKKSDPQALYNMLCEKVLAHEVKDKNWKNKKIYLQCEAKDALKLACELTKEDEPILACGSFYLAGVIKEALY